MRGGQRALATDRDQHVDAVVVECLLDLVEPGAQLVGVHPGGAEHRAALGQQPVVAVVVGQLNPSILQEPTPAIEEADDLRAVPHVAGADDRADHRVQPGTVTPAGKNSDAHVPHPPLLERRWQRTSRNFIGGTHPVEPIIGQRRRHDLQPDGQIVVG